MESAPSNAINLALGELSFPMPERLKEQAIKLLMDGNPAYTPNAGLNELRDLMGEICQVKPEQVIVCNGAEEAVFITLLACLNSGDMIAIPDPDYPAYPAIASILEAKVIRLPFNTDFKSIDWDRWDKLLSGAKAIILSAPSNPSGFCFDNESALRFSELCNRHKILVCVDEIYDKLWFESIPVSIADHLEGVVRIGGLSKSHLMSGWRLGWIIAPEIMASSLTKAKQYISTCSHWLSQKLALFALSDEGMEIAELTRMQLRANRDWLKSRFTDKLPSGISQIHFPEATPYILMQTKDPLSYCRSMAEHGVVLVPGQAFGRVSDSFVRLNFGVRLDLLQQAIEILSIN
jgi:aspartate/methionine/tyrosine aminotransferase